MTEHDALADRFEAQRGRLEGVAYRMLGSLSEAEDAVQESWLRLQRADTSGVVNLAGWLTTVVSRVCLDMLRSRASRREELAGHQVPDEIQDPWPGGDPEQEAVLADSVGRALPAGRGTEVRGARAVAEEIVVFGRNARFADLALVNGAVGIVVAPQGRLRLALEFTIEDGRIAGYELIGDAARLQQLDLAIVGA